jgi:hypothetical protein
MAVTARACLLGGKRTSMRVESIWKPRWVTTVPDSSFSGGFSETELGENMIEDLGRTNEIRIRGEHREEVVQVRVMVIRKCIPLSITTTRKLEVYWMADAGMNLKGPSSRPH